MTKELKAVTAIRDLLKQAKAAEKELNDCEKLYESHPDNAFYELQFDNYYRDFYDLLALIVDELITLGIAKLTAWQMARNNLAQIENIISKWEA